MVKFQASFPGNDKPYPKLTSMIDVVFLLLVFFLVSTHFPDPEAVLKCWRRQNGINDGPFIQLEETRLTLARQNGLFTLTYPDLTSPTGQRMFPMQTVQDWQTRQAEKVPKWPLLKRWLEARNRAWRQSGTGSTCPVILEFKPDVPMRHVATLLDTCKAAGIHQYQLAYPEELF